MSKKGIGAVTAIGLVALGCALLIKHTIPGINPLGEFLMGASASLLLLGLVVDRIGLGKVRAVKSKLLARPIPPKAGS